MNKEVSGEAFLDQQLFSITDLSKEFDISARAIRFYESKGLVSPQRVGATRVYGRSDRARLILILRGKRLGFSLNEIGKYLSLYDSDSEHKVQTDMLVSKIDERLGLLKTQLVDIQQTIEDLSKMRQQALS